MQKHIKSPRPSTTWEFVPKRTFVPSTEIHGPIQRSFGAEADGVVASKLLPDIRKRIAGQRKALLNSEAEAKFGSPERE